MVDWLTSRPIAHRGLHDAATGAIENTLTAFRAAIAAGYAIECDVQISADGEAMVHHDDALGRLTEGTEALAAMSADALRRVRFKSTSDPMLTLGELCDLTASRVTLVIEMKSRFDGDTRVARRAASVLEGYAGPAALMSFDPLLVAAVRDAAPARLRGLVAMRRGAADPAARMSTFAYAKGLLSARPQFLAYRVADLATLPPRAARGLFRWPLLTWTVRTPQDRAYAKRHADQMIFEGFRP